MVYINVFLVLKNMEYFISTTFFFSTLCTPIAHNINGLFGDSEQLFFFPIGDCKYTICMRVNDAFVKANIAFI